MSLLFPIAVLGPVALVVVMVVRLLWRERSSQREARVALVSGVLLAAWALTATVLSYRGLFQPRSGEKFPPVGINLIVILTIFAASLALSSSLRSLLARQPSLIRLHVWRLEGIVFLTLMLLGQVPALWAIPAGTGDILVYNWAAA